LTTGTRADDNDALLRGKFDIALLTYERLAALAVTLLHVLRKVGVIVIDEVQMITDQNRGANLEFLLFLVRSWMCSMNGRWERTRVISDSRGGVVCR